MARFIRRGLTEQSYAVDAVTTGSDAIDHATSTAYDVIVLDAMIPPPDGFEICRMLRAAGNDVSIVMLTARDALADRVEGLDSGADDYMVKPFEFAELLARLRAALRRRGAHQDPVIEVEDLRIDTRSHRVSRAGHEIVLTSREYVLLQYLAINAGRVIARDAIAEHVWSSELDPFTNIIDVYVSRLRRLVDDEHETKLIHTIRGAGYVLGA